MAPGRERSSMSKYMRVSRRRAWPAVALGTIALAAAGCGSSSDDSSSKKSGSSDSKTQTSKALPEADINWPDPQPAVEERKGGSGTPIKVGVLSDCQGAFGSFDNQDLAGVVSAMSQFAGARPKNPNKPRDGWTGGAIGDHPLKLVGVGCSDDKADTAIKETRRLMEQLDADVMIGPLSGDESIAVANYAKQHPDKTFVDGA